MCLILIKMFIGSFALGEVVYRRVVLDLIVMLSVVMGRYFIEGAFNQICCPARTVGNDIN